MDPIAAAVLSSWSVAPGLALGLALTSVVYLRGFRALRAQLPARFPDWRRDAFLCGIAAVALALLSPLDAFAQLLLQVHMVQHWLLMMVAPPLLWLGAPAVPLMRGLPRRWLKRGLGPFLAWPALRRGLERVTRPGVAWLAFPLVTLVWHLPVPYQAALGARGWHDLEHACFLAASLLFWLPVIAPWPLRRLPAGGVALYLGLAALWNTLFSAVFAFSTRVFYPHYLNVPRPWGIDALGDQNAAGAFLWVAASLPMLAAAAVAIVAGLDGPRAGSVRAVAPGARRRARRNPGGGRLRRLAASLALRRALQWAMLGAAAAIVLDGWLGPQRPSSLNLAGVLPWTYWRGLVVVALLVVGNLFCAVCPFTLSRDLAGRLLGRRLRWPPALRNKWLAVALFAVYLWAYEAFSLWDSPWWTAWIVVGYFAACFLVEGLFPRGTFCRYVCPIGSFHFVGAGISPVEVEARDPDVCAGCTSHDCLRGNAAAPGCPTGLFLPTKSGGLDCTLCLDCVRACPHENATLVTLDPGARLGPSPAKHFAGLDVGWLALVFCFGAFANAAAMVAPLSAWWRGLAAETGASPAIVLGVAFVGALGLVPAVSVWLCGILGRALSGATATPVRLTPAFAPALVPVGFAMWLAHFGFHGVTGIASLGPVAGRAVAGLGLSRGAGPGMAALPDPGLLAALPGLEIAVLGLGLVVSVAVAWRIARGRVASPRAGLGLAAPWMLLATVLYVAGVWIVLQPMQMRGLGTM